MLIEVVSKSPLGLNTCVGPIEGFETTYRNHLYRTDAVKAGLWPYFDRGAVGNQPGDFLHLLVGDGDAAFGPVDLRMKAAKPGETIFYAMDHDIAAWGNAQFFGTLYIFFIGVGNAKREVVIAVPVS